MRICLAVVWTGLQTAGYKSSNFYPSKTKQKNKRVNVLGHCLHNWYTIMKLLENALISPAIVLSDYVSATSSLCHAMVKG